MLQFAREVRDAQQTEVIDSALQTVESSGLRSQEKTKEVVRNDC